MKRTEQKAARRELTRAVFRQNHVRFFVSLVLLALTAAASLVMSWFLGQVLDAITAVSLARLLWLAKWFLCFTAVYCLLDSVMYRCKSRFIHKGLTQYKNAAFARISQKGIAAFTRESTGRYISVLTNDANTIEENYLNRSLLLVFQCLSLIGALSMMFYYSWQLTLVALVLSALPIVASVVLGKQLVLRERAVSDGNERFVSKVKDLLTGYAVIKSFKAEPEAKTLFDHANREVEQIKFRRRWMDCLIMVVNWDLCSSLVQFGLFFCGAYLAIAGKMTVGTVVIITNLANFVVQPIHNIPQYWATFKAASGLIDKLAGLMTENTQSEGQTVPPVLHDAIVLEHTGFAYEANTPVLQDVSLRLEAGKSYAIVGASGSGKSTLLNLLMGSSGQYTGSIAIDGQELREIDPDSLYDLMCIMQQNVFIFDSDIRSNVTMFRSFDAAAVERAMALAGLTQLVQARGTDYRCGENGAGLSGGEKQRIAIARCLLRHTPVLLMDEATASLDAQTSFEITDAILNIDGLTRVMVTHRLEEAILRRCDEIIVLRQGRICAHGGFDRLMAEKGYFYSLYTVANP